MPGQSWSGTVTDGSSWVWPEPVCVGGCGQCAVCRWTPGYLGTQGFLVQCGDDD